MLKSEYNKRGTSISSTNLLNITDLSREKERRG